jgi:hypothetical protein
MVMWRSYPFIHIEGEGNVYILYSRGRKRESHRCWDREIPSPEWTVNNKGNRMMNSEENRLSEVLYSVLYKMCCV